MSGPAPRFCLYFLTLLLSAAPLQAHRGAVAVVLPVDGIAVDGDLSDWPDGLPEYPIAALDWGLPPSSAGDLSGSFRVAFGPADGALYVAVEARDDSTVVEAPGDFHAVRRALMKRNMVAGLPLAPYYPELPNHFLFCATETKSREDMDSLVTEIVS